MSLSGGPLSPTPLASSDGAAGMGRSGTTSISSGPPSPQSGAYDQLPQRAKLNPALDAVPTPPQSPLAALADSAAALASTEGPTDSANFNAPSPPPLRESASSAKAAPSSPATADGKGASKRPFGLVDFEIDTDRLLPAAKRQKTTGDKQPEFAVPFQVTPFSVMGNPVLTGSANSPDLVSRLTFPPVPGPSAVSPPVYRVPAPPGWQGYPGGLRYSPQPHSPISPEMRGATAAAPPDFLLSHTALGLPPGGLPHILPPMVSAHLGAVQKSAPDIQLPVKPPSKASSIPKPGGRKKK